MDADNKYENFVKVIYVAQNIKQSVPLYFNYSLITQNIF